LGLDPVQPYLEQEESSASRNPQISSWSDEEISGLDPVSSYLELEDSPAGLKPHIFSLWAHEEIQGWILFRLTWSQRTVLLVVIP
jgi:hypothetical protein